MLQRLVLLAGLLSVAACGFHLRDSTSIPFKSVYIGLGETSPVAVVLRRGIRGNGPTEVIDDPTKAAIRIEILGESLREDILTINSAGLAAEYYLYYQIRFRVTDNLGHTYIRPTQLILRRLILANTNAVLAENFEISQRISDMQADAAQQILRRLEALTPGAFVDPGQPDKNQEHDQGQDQGDGRAREQPDVAPIPAPLAPLAPLTPSSPTP